MSSMYIGSRISIKRFALKTVAILMIAVMVTVTLFSNNVNADNLLLERDRVEAFVDDFFNEQSDRNIGAVVSIVTNEGVLFERGFGYADKEKGIKVDPKETVFQIASVSKLFTSLAVMQLTEIGKLKVEDDVNNLLPGPIDTDGRIVTIEQLLTHTSGFDETLIRPVSGWNSTGSLMEWKHVVAPPIVREPGIVKSYSNFGMALLGYVVQEKAEEPFAQYVQRNITEPLGMTRSGFRYTEEMEAARARIYTAQGDRIQEIEGIPPFFVPAGAFASTGEDMGKFMMMLLNDGELNGQRLIESDTLDEMTSLHASYHPQLGGMAYGFARILHRGYTVLGHEGDLSGWHSGLWLVPEDRVGIFISINTDDAAFRNEFFMDFMNRFFLYRSSTITSSQDGLSGEEQLLPVSHYKGTYAPTRLAESSISRINMILDDRMQVTLTPSGEGMLNASGSSGISHFRLRPDGLWLSPYNSFAFHEDSEGLYMQFASSPSIDYRRLAWHEDNGLHIGAISILLFLLLASGISGIILAIRKRSFGVFLPAASSWIHLAFSIGAIVLSSVDDQGHSWWWTTMFLLLALPVVAIVLAACTIVLAAIGKIHLGTRSQRFGWIGGMTLALQFIFAAYLYYWNLFGWFGVESVL